jgi:GDPmannose 4,6-dehydratase
MKKALITGISGQDGSYLSELLLSKDYDVHGLVMRVELEDTSHRLVNIGHILDKITFYPAELESFPTIFNAIEKICPDECYHLAAQSFVDYSFDTEFSTVNTNFTGTHNILAALKMICPHCRFYFAGSSEMFGRVISSPQDETTPFNPRSIYGITKVAGHHLSMNYRERYGMFTSTGILFNHESERRGFEFVTRKISTGAASIKLGISNTLTLGNMDARRDWRYAPEYVQAMWLMLQQETPDNYVIGTGEVRSVREFVEIAFSTLGLDWQKYVIVDEKLFRPSDTMDLCANPLKANRELKWQPLLSFSELVNKMVQNDFEKLQKGIG